MKKEEVQKGYNNSTTLDYEAKNLVSNFCSSSRRNRLEECEKMEKENYCGVSELNRSDPFKQRNYIVFVNRYACQLRKQIFFSNDENRTGISVLICVCTTAG
jgi:hypothetical protein